MAFVVSITITSHLIRFLTYSHRADLPLRDAFTDKSNAKHGWTDPDDPSKNRPTVVHNVQSPDKKHFKKAIGDFVKDKINDGEITNRKSLVTALNEAGWHLSNEGKKTITVINPAGKTPGEKKVCMRGRFFEEGFFVDQDEVDKASFDADSKQAFEDGRKDRFIASQSRWLKLVTSRQQRLEKRYQSASRPWDDVEEKAGDFDFSADPTPNDQPIIESQNYELGGAETGGGSNAESEENDEHEQIRRDFLPDQTVSLDEVLTYVRQVFIRGFKGAVGALRQAIRSNSERDSNTKTSAGRPNQLVVEKLAAQRYEAAERRGSEAQARESGGERQNLMPRM